MEFYRRTLRPKLNEEELPKPIEDDITNEFYLPCKNCMNFYAFLPMNESHNIELFNKLISEIEVVSQNITLKI